MVAGYAVGGGHVLHMVCDLTIAAENAVFGQTGPKVGSFDAGYGSTQMAAIIGALFSFFPNPETVVFPRMAAIRGGSKDSSGSRIFVLGARLHPEAARALSGLFPEPRKPGWKPACCSSFALRPLHSTSQVFDITLPYSEA